MAPFQVSASDLTNQLRRDTRHARRLLFPTQASITVFPRKITRRTKIWDNIQVFFEAVIFFFSRTEKHQTFRAELRCQMNKSALAVDVQQTVRQHTLNELYVRIDYMKVSICEFDTPPRQLEQLLSLATFCWARKYIRARERTAILLRCGALNHLHLLK